MINDDEPKIIFIKICVNLCNLWTVKPNQLIHRGGHGGHGGMKNNFIKKLRVLRVLRGGLKTEPIN
jgi:hypothetical protein